MMIENGNYYVYIHTNKINGKRYVGQSRQDPIKRWHVNGTGYKPKKNNVSRFWNAIEKYGWDNFDHEIIASNLTLKEANQFETLLITKLQTQNSEFGYNIMSGGGNRSLPQEVRDKIAMSRKGKNYGLIGEKAPFYNHHHTEETKNKIKQKMTGELNPQYGKHHSDATKEKIRNSMASTKKIQQLTCSGELVAEYPSIHEAARITGIRRCCITAVINGRQKTAGKFLWKVCNDTERVE